MERELTQLRSALTRAKNSNNPQKVITTVNHALARFEQIGWPDSWSDWTRAKSDAEFKLRYRS